MKAAHFIGVILPQTPAHLFKPKYEEGVKYLEVLGKLLLHTNFWRCVKFMKTAHFIGVSLPQTPAHLTQILSKSM